MYDLLHKFTLVTMNFSILMLLIFGYTSGIQVQPGYPTKYCFKFTWPGPLKDGNNEINCTVLESIKIPCVDRVVYNPTPPNLTEMWQDKENYACPLQRGDSCIRYTYSFDNAVTNATYFCGKMIENKETPIQNGCFSQKIGGYDVEACACQSTGFGDGMPCNSSTKLNYSLAFLLLFLLLLSLIQN